MIHVRVDRANAVCWSRGPGRPIRLLMAIETVVDPLRARKLVAPNSPTDTAALIAAALPIAGIRSGSVTVHQRRTGPAPRSAAITANSPSIPRSAGPVTRTASGSAITE